MFARFPSNSEADASESPGNLERTVSNSTDSISESWTNDCI